LADASSLTIVTDQWRRAIVTGQHQVTFFKIEMALAGSKPSTSARSMNSATSTRRWPLSESAPRHKGLVLAKPRGQFGLGETSAWGSRPEQGRKPWLSALRGPSIGLTHTPFAAATCGIIRFKLLKIAALVTASARRIKFALASACPYADT
jgi:hypothetical protein